MDTSSNRARENKATGPGGAGNETKPLFSLLADT